MYMLRRRYAEDCTCLRRVYTWSQIKLMLVSIKSAIIPYLSSNGTVSVYARDNQSLDAMQKRHIDQ